MAVVTAALGDPLRAARLWGTADVVHEEIGFAIWDPVEYERCVAAAREKAGDERFRAAWEEGRSTRVEDAVESALAAFVEAS